MRGGEAVKWARWVLKRMRELGPKLYDMFEEKPVTVMTKSLHDQLQRERIERLCGTSHASVSSSQPAVDYL